MEETVNALHIEKQGENEDHCVDVPFGCKQIQQGETAQDRLPHFPAAKYEVDWRGYRVIENHLKEEYNIAR